MNNASWQPSIPHYTHDKTGRVGGAHFAGPTQEAIDPVRFISNRSSGKMGYALAEAARVRGAEVVLVSGRRRFAAPTGVERCSVTTAEEMRKVIMSRFAWSDTVIMAAAVADFRPTQPSTHKLKSAIARSRTST